MADLSVEISGTNPPFVAAAHGADFDKSGYVEHEYVAKGTATAYAADGALTEDGRWKLKAGPEARYVTRIVVRRPEKTTDFSGTVLVEWLNVSGGLDAGPDYSSNEEEILREGHIWVGVSTQYLGVEGGPVLVAAPGAESIAGKGLKATDPERYKDLKHPGDGYSFDMFTQIARSLVVGGGVLGGMKPTTMIAMGESQSAIALTTYYNGVQPLTQMFDGFFVHSRASVALPLVGTAKYADLAGAIGKATVKFRDDLAAPVMDVQAEGDLTGVLNSAVARQDDSDTFRLWEVAGTAHADRHLLGPIADAANCGKPVNNGPLHFITKAALHALVAWVTKGTLPPEAPRIELTTGATPAIARDAVGIAKGGIRTPLVNAPVEVLSGEPGPSKDIFCLLLGSTTPIPPAQLAARYRSATDYQMKYDKSADAAVAAGLLLGEDRDDLIGDAQPDLVSDAQTASTAPSTSTTGPAAAMDMRTKRYCEVLLVQITNGNAVAEVYNSYPLNECPEDKWKALDPVAIAKEAKVTVATLNGPRFWLMNHVEKVGGTKDLPIKDFGGIEMYRQASVDVGPIADAQKPYVTHTVDRKTVFVFNAGETVYELTGADGTRYVMQTWSQQKHPALEEAGLATLGAKLALPTGWKYEARKLTEDLRIDTTGAPAKVLQDDFANSYSQVPD